MAEAHPVGFQWVIEAKKRGARVIHIDPRFTRTSAQADTYVALRAGSDVAFLGGIVNYILTNELDFREYVVAYTNAATIVSEKFRDTDDLGGLFSGFDAESRTYTRRPGNTRARNPTRSQRTAAAIPIRRPTRPAPCSTSRTAPRWTRTSFAMKP